MAKFFVIGAVIGAICYLIFREFKKLNAPTFELTMEDRVMRHHGRFKHGFLKEVERILVDEDIDNAVVRGFGSGRDTRLEITGDEGVERAAQRIRNMFFMLH